MTWGLLVNRFSDNTRYSWWYNFWKVCNYSQHPRIVIDCYAALSYIYLFMVKIFNKLSSFNVFENANPGIPELSSGICRSRSIPEWYIPDVTRELHFIVCVRSLILVRWNDAIDTVSLHLHFTWFHHALNSFCKAYGAPVACHHRCNPLQLRQLWWTTV